MDAEFWINVITRWLHVASAVVAAGAAVFMWLVVIPAARGAGAEQSAVLNRLLPGFRRALHIGLGLLLLTGFYNFFIALPRISELGAATSTYHAVIGTKILLVFVLFGFVSAALASLTNAAGIPDRFIRWMGVVVLLAVVILFLSAILRRTWYLDPRLAAPAGATAPASPVVEPIEPQ